MNTPDLQAIIRSLVERWLASNDRPDLTAVVCTSGALPVYYGMGATLLLRPDGEILCLDDASDDDVPHLETGEGWRTIAIVVGVEKHPELLPLLPIRPVEAETCDWCSGYGRIRDHEIIYGILCGKCFGLGWLAPPS